MVAVTLRKPLENGPSPQEVRTALAGLYEPIAADLARVEQALKDTLQSDSDFIAELLKRVQLYGGKRLRPALLLLAAKACGAVTDDHIRLAACVELIHVATLVHDDVLDEADKRRHVATVNAEWGTEPSLLLGDFLFTHAFQLAANVQGTDACRWLSSSTNKICAGELHQVSRRGMFELAEAEHLKMLEGKTAELFAAACGLGAKYAGGSEREVEALAEYGRTLGVAFQIADDVLDLLGDEAATGKSVGSDLKKQKMTLPLILYRESAAPENVALLRRAFDEADAHARGAVGRLLAASDILDRTKARGLDYVNAALESLAVLPDSPAKRSLLDLARFSMERSA